MIQPEMAPAIRYFVLLIFSTEHSRVAKIVFMLSETDWVLPYLQRILSILFKTIICVKYAIIHHSSVFLQISGSEVIPAK